MSSSKACDVVDEVRVLRLLRSVTDDLAVLQEEASADETRRADPLWLRGVKCTFVTAIEACVDVAQHICASEGWGPPRDNADAVRVLGAHKVLPPELADRLSKAVGFRNVLVHEYSDVTTGGAGNQTQDRIVLAQLANPSDLADFVAAIAEWTSTGGS